MPYESARDLPSYVQMTQQIQALRWVRFLLSKEKRENLADVESQLRRLTDTVDEFYRRLGPRSWVFHDDFNVERIVHLLQPDDGDEAAETRLIAYYQEEDTLRFMVMRLTGLEEMRKRLNLIEHALVDYREGRYYAVVLVLLTVMDGFVNDVQPDLRKGLHARDSDELDAWDSVVGHHQGLGAAHRTFRRTFKASSDEEVHELFRNGIVHGNLTNYDNKIVATKAWNRLFAVADWARAETRRIAPKPEPPTWRGLAADLAESARTKAAVEAFEPRTLTAADDEHFSSNDAYAACVVFLCAWQRTNFGAIAKVLASLIAKSYGSRAPRMVREEYTGFTLTDYSIMSLDFVAAAVCIISVSVTVNGEQRQAKLRWVREAEDGDIAPVGLPGEWRLISWGPYAILRDA